MKNEKLLEKLNEILNSSDSTAKIYTMQLIEEVKKELIQEADTKRTGNKNRTKIFDKILKESEKINSIDFTKKSFIIEDYQLFSTPYRYIATKQHTDHINGGIPDKNYCMFAEFLHRIINAPASLSYTKLTLPAENELKTLLKILKAQNKGRKHKIDVFRVSIEDKWIFNLEYVIDAITVTGSTDIYCNSEYTAREAGILSEDKNTIAVFMPIKARDAKTIDITGLPPYDLFIDSNGKATITNPEMFEKVQED